MELMQADILFLRAKTDELTLRSEDGGIQVALGRSEFAGSWECSSCGVLDRRVMAEPKDTVHTDI